MKNSNFFDVLNFDETNFVLLYFFRYCLPRHTYMVAICCKNIEDNLESLNEETKTIIIKEIEEYLSRDSNRKIFERMDDEKRNNLAYVLKEIKNVKVKNKRALKIADLDLIFPSVVRYCLFYDNGDKEKVFEIFGRVAKLLPEKSITIIERDIRWEIREDFKLLDINDEGKEFWKNFYNNVFKVMKYRWIEQWD